MVDVICSVLQATMYHLSLYSLVQGICQSMTEAFAVQLLNHVAKQLESSGHLEFYLIWTKELLFTWGKYIKENSLEVMPLLINLQKSLARTSEDLGRM